MSSSVGASYPEGINPGHLHYKTDIGKAQIYMGGDPKHSKNWCNVDSKIITPKNIKYGHQYNSLDEAILDIGGSQTTLILDVALSVLSAIIIPKTLTLQITGQGKLIKSNGSIDFKGTILDPGQIHWLFNFLPGDIIGAGLNRVDPHWWGASFDGSTDDTEFISLALSTGRPVYLTGIAKGNIILPNTLSVVIENTAHLITDNFRLNGTVDCGNSYHIKHTGKMIIVPPDGSVWGMRWRNTRYSSWDCIQIGIAGTYTDGIGLYISGGINEGVYWNTFNHLSVTWKRGMGVLLQTDDLDNNQRIASNLFNHIIIDHTNGGISFIGASDNIITAIDIENSIGQILNFEQTSGGASSDKNHLNSIYLENPDKADSLNMSEGCVRNFLHFTYNDGATDIPGSYWADTGNYYINDANTLNYFGIFRANKIQRKKVIEKKIENYVITSIDIEVTFSNAGASSIVYITLPPADSLREGEIHTFIRDNAIHAFRIKPSPNQIDFIRNAGSEGGIGKYISLDTDGASITIQCMSTGKWDIISFNSGSINFEV